MTFKKNAWKPRKPRRPVVGKPWKQAPKGGSGRTMRQLEEIVRKRRVDAERRSHLENSCR